MQLIRIWFDGGSLGNPGKGYGSYKIDGGPQLQHEARRIQFGDFLTNNQAEYLALIAALKWLLHNRPDGDHRLEIWTDSMLVKCQVPFPFQGRIGGPNPSWRCKVAHLRELRDEVRNLLSEYRHYELKWNPRKVNVEHFGH